MIIKRLSASFGRLVNETLTLQEGLNIIEAPNETGKSTWCAFIRAMLYGIRTSDRDKAGYLSAKTRYRPWSGAPMAGTMDIETNGVSVTLQRTTEGKLPMKNFQAVLTGTGEPIPELYPDTAGEALTGASEEVFERSAFISQAGVRVSQSPELEKRITSLVATGDETVSYTETDERLRAWLRKRRFNKTGAIPALEEKLSGIEQQLIQIEAALDQAALMRQEVERLKSRHQQLSDELRQCQSYESSRDLSHARAEYERVKAVYDNIYRELTRNGRAPSEEDIAAIRGDLKALEALGAVCQGEQRHMSDVKADHDNLLAVKQASSFSARETSRDVDTAVRLEEDIKKVAISHPVSLLLLILTAAFIVLAALLPDFRLYAAALALIGAVLLIRQMLRYRKLCSKLDALLSKSGAESADAMEAQYQSYTQLLDELSEAENAYRSAEKSVFSAAENYRAIRNGLSAKLEAAGLFSEPESAGRELARIEALLSRLAAAKAEVKASESFLNKLSEKDTADNAQDEIPAPTRSRADIETELAAVTARLEDMKGRYSMALGQVRALGDPVILGSERKTAEQALCEQTAQYEAIALAVDTLKAASVELQSRFSPLLGETAGRILAQLTDGRYEKLAFDKTLDASAQSKDEPVSRSVLALSAGTADQIYLALRLAVCELILPDNACPLILDDTLCNFDDQRAWLALDYLRELSKMRQILLFTCHAREARYFEGSTDVNKISL